MVTGRATGEWTLWVVALSCALHATEEILTGWQPWARSALGIEMPTSIFVIMNVVLVVAALVFARVGWRQTSFALVIPAATLVNAVCFHIIPTIAMRRVAPGLYTAIGLYLPFSSWAFVNAALDGVPQQSRVRAACVGGMVAVAVVLAARLL